MWMALQELHQDPCVPALLPLKLQNLIIPVGVCEAASFRWSNTCCMIVEMGSEFSFSSKGIWLLGFRV